MLPGGFHDDVESHVVIKEGDGATELAVLHLGDDEAQVLLAIDCAGDGLIADGVGAGELFLLALLDIGLANELPRFEWAGVGSLSIYMIFEVDSELFALMERIVGPCAVCSFHLLGFPLADANDVGTGFIRCVVLIFAARGTTRHAETDETANQQQNRKKNLFHKCFEFKRFVDSPNP